jgi:ATP-dependent Clp protease protease subunit
MTTPIIRIFKVIMDAELGGDDLTTVQTQLAQIGDVPELEIQIGSQGGDALIGAGIYALLAAHPAKKTVKIIGAAGSAAATIALAGDKIEMPSNSLLVFHPPYSGRGGNSSKLRETADSLDAVKATIADVISKKSGRSLEDANALISKESWLSAEQAKEFGFPIAITQSVKVPKIANSVSPFTYRFEHMPAIAAQLFSVPQIEPAKEPPMAEITLTEEQLAERIRLANEEAVKNALEKFKPDQSKLDADLAAARKLAADEAVKNEVQRRNDVTALCKEAGCLDMADTFCADTKYDVTFVRNSLFNELCKRNTAPNGGSGKGNGTGGDADPHAAIRAEYAAHKAAHPSVYNSISEEQYVRSECRSRGIAPPEKKAA